MSTKSSMKAFWPRNPRRFSILGATAALLLMTAAVHHDATRLSSLQLEYLSTYLRTSYHWSGAASNYSTLEFEEGGQMRLARDVDILDANRQKPLLSDAALSRGATRPHWRQLPNFSTDTLNQLLQNYVYDGQTFTQICRRTTFAFLFAALLLSLGIYMDADYRKQLREGIVVRGPLEVDRFGFNRIRKSDGIGFPTATWPSPSELLAFALVAFRVPILRTRWKYLRWKRLSIPASTETSHTLIMGDTGTGKSVILRHFVRDIQRRGHTAVIYDPKGDFTAEFYNPERGDIILNPLDERCPYWEPAFELSINAEALTLSHSLFPDKPNENAFFPDACRRIFAHLMQFAPDPATLATWLVNGNNEIDDRVAGTELAEMISPKAEAQRAGVLSSLSFVGHALRLLPTKGQATKYGTWSAKTWAEKRKGWIFITTTPMTHDAQLPLISLWLDTLLLRLMTGSIFTNMTPVWMIIDELSQLQRLPQLEKGLTLTREYEIRLILGFQGVAQLQKSYGNKGAQVILSQPATKIALRTNEPDAAEWISRVLGDQEICRITPSFSQSADGLRSREQRSYAREDKIVRAVMASEILGLENLYGCLKQGNYITRFKTVWAEKQLLHPPLLHRPQAQFKPLTLPVTPAIPPALQTPPTFEPSADLEALHAQTAETPTPPTTPAAQPKPPRSRQQVLPL